MTGAIIVAAVIFVVVAAVLLIRLTGENARQEKMVMRVRTTELYGHIYPMLRQYDNDFIESVTIRREGITIRTVVPLGGEIRYTFARHGLDEPGDDVLYALAQAVMVDMKALRNEKHYRFRCHTIEKPNGETQEWYDYIISSSWKDEILRGEARKRNRIV